MIKTKRDRPVFRSDFTASDLLKFVLVIGCGLGLLVLLIPNEASFVDEMSSAKPTRNTLYYLSRWLDEDPEQRQARLLLAEKYLANHDAEQALETVEPLLRRPVMNAEDQTQVSLYWRALLTHHLALNSLLQSAYYQDLSKPRQNKLFQRFAMEGVNRKTATHPRLPLDVRVVLARAADRQQQAALWQVLLEVSLVTQKDIDSGATEQWLTLLSNHGQWDRAIDFATKVFQFQPNEAHWLTAIELMIRAEDRVAAAKFYQQTHEQVDTFNNNALALLQLQIKFGDAQIKSERVAQWLDQQPLPQAETEQLIHLAVAHQKLAVAERLGAAHWNAFPDAVEIGALLHDIYRWQGKLEPAFTISQSMLGLTGGVVWLHHAIDEAKGLSDYVSLSGLYLRAAELGDLAQLDVAHFLQVVNRALTQVELSQLLTNLVQQRPDDTEIQQAYLNFVIDHYPASVLDQLRPQLLMASWQLTEANKYQLALKAFNAGHAESALAWLAFDTDWDQVQDRRYLETAHRLSVLTNDHLLARRLSLALFEQGGHPSKYYSAIARSYADPTLLDTHFLKTYFQTGHAQLLRLSALHADITQNAQLMGTTLKWAEKDALMEQLPALWIYAAYHYAKIGELKASAAATHQAAEHFPSDPRVRYLELGVALQQDDTPRLKRLVQQYERERADQPPSLFGKLAQANERVGRVSAAIGWYKKLVEHNPELRWPLHRLAALYQRNGDVDRAYQLKQVLVAQLVYPEEDQYAVDEMDAAMLERVMGRAVSGQVLRDAMQRKLSVTNANINDTAPESRRLLVQLVDRLLQDYEYHAASVWQTLGEQQDLALAPWQLLALNDDRSAGVDKKRLSDHAAGLSGGDLYQTWVADGQIDRAWVYGQQQFSDSQLGGEHAGRGSVAGDELWSENGEEAFSQRSRYDLPRFEHLSARQQRHYLRVSHLGNYSDKAIFWAAGWSLVDGDDQTEQRMQIKHQQPTARGAVNLRAEQLLSDKSAAPLTSFEQDRTALHLSHRWDHKNHHLTTGVAFHQRDQETTTGGHLGFGTTLGDSLQLLVTAGWNNPFIYNDQFYSLMQSDGLSLAYQLGVNSLLNASLQLDYDRVQTIFGQRVADSYRMSGEIASDLLRSENVVEPYFSWYEHRFDRVNDELVRLFDQGADSALNSAVDLEDSLIMTTITESLRLDDYRQLSLGLRLGQKQLIWFSQPIQHLLDIRLSYEPDTSDRALSFNDRWRFRIGEQRFLELNYGKLMSSQTLSDDHLLALKIQQFFE